MFLASEFCVPQAQTLADLKGVQLDLLTVGQFCDKFIDVQSRPPADPLLLDSLCAAALVRYGRCFGASARTSCGPLVAKLPPDLRIAHQKYKDLRDKWIAHSVNTFEDNRVVVYLKPEFEGNREVSSVETLQQRVYCLFREEMEELKRLATQLNGEVWNLVQQETEKLLTLARLQPVDDFYARAGPITMPVLDLTPGKRRERWQ